MKMAFLILPRKELINFPHATFYVVWYCSESVPTLGPSCEHQANVPAYVRCG